MSAPNMSISLTANDACNSLLFSDTTTYTAGTILSSTVTSVNLRLDYSTLGTYIRYTFTVSNNVITAAHLILTDGSSTDILSQISHTFPFVNFGITANYGKTIPAVEDGIYYATYEIIGNSGGAYDYTTTEELAVTCSVCCCISNLFQKLNPDCACDDKAWMTAMRAQAYLNAATYSTQVGYVDNAVAALKVASDICQAGCGCGG